jgi:ribosomal protein S7
MKLKKEKINLYNIFLGFLIKNGKKMIAKKILTETFLLVSNSVNLPIHFIFLKIFFLLNIFVEIKKIKSRRNIHIVPFPISFKRKLYLIIKNLMESVKKNKNKIPFSKKLSLEIINLLNNNKTNSLEKKKLVLSQAVLNRSKIHFRW